MGRSGCKMGLLVNIHPSLNIPHTKAPSHMNSVDKDAYGDYLISGRDSHTIYKICGRTGSILWRLGGKHSTFHLSNFTFSMQHDARFISVNSTTTTLSLFNNAYNWTHTPRTSSSSVLLISLPTSPSPFHNTATLIHRYPRPDQGLTWMRGNAQILPNGNAFICWSKNAYLSEYTADGNLLLEAQLSARSFATYRAYKSNFTAMPDSKPTLKALTFRISGSCESTGITTVAYVSWNGATEVDSWNFYVSAVGPAAGPFSHIGNAQRAGFETTFVAAGYKPWVFAEAIDVEGRSLGNSSVERAEIPSRVDGCEVKLPFDNIGATSSSEKRKIGLLGDGLRHFAGRIAQLVID